MMCCLVGIILWCCGLASSNSDVVRPGTLLAPEGTTLMVEDVINVQYSLHTLAQDATILPDIGRKLDQVANLLSYVSSKTHNKTLFDIVRLQESRMENMRDTMSSLIQDFPFDTKETTSPPKPSSSRNKRGLFDFGGLLLNKLFGTAQASDVTAIGRKLQLVTRAINTQNRLVQLHHVTMSKFRSQIKALTTRSNALTSCMQTLEAETINFESLFLVTQYLLTLDNEIQSLRDHSNTIISVIVDAGLSRVNSQLLPLSHLREALIIARANFSLSPLFDSARPEFYYPLMEATLTDLHIVVHIPLRSRLAYNTYSVTPFPFLVNDTLLTLSSRSDRFLIAQDYMSVSLTSNAALSHCRSSFLHVQVCPAYLFALLPAEAAACEISLVRNISSLITKNCQFTPVDDTLPVHHAHVGGNQFFYFLKPTSVTLICTGMSTNLVVSGFYIAPDYCEVRSSSMSTLPSRQHMGLFAEVDAHFHIIPPMFDIHLQNLSLTSEKLTFLSYLNDSDVLLTNVPLLMNSHFLYPTMSLPIVSIIFILAVLVICLRRLDNRLSEIRKASGLEPVIKVTQKKLMVQKDSVLQDTVDEP